jgi:hypothetical protein
MRTAPVVKLTDEERTQLEKYSRGRSVPVRLVQRAKIILMAAENLQNIDIAAQLQNS